MLHRFPPLPPLRGVLALALALASACGGSKDAGGEDPPGGGDPVGDGTDGGVTPLDEPGVRFEASPTEWAQPQGGIAVQGFPSLSRQEGFENVGDEYWVTQDLTGDGIPDLVVTTVIRDVLGTASEDDIYDEPYGFPSSPHWRVYAGTTTGFSPQFTEWPLPTGGKVSRGFNRVRSQTHPVERMKNDRGAPNDEGDEAWVLEDMDGDGKPDLVVTGVAKELVQVGYVFTVNGPTPHWRVYRNTGAGFEANAQEWPVPTAFEWDLAAGLANVANPLVVFHAKQLWQLADMNGDRRPDLVAYAEVQKVSTTMYRARPFSHPTAPAWRVFLNSGLGFEPTAVNWPLPKQRGRGDDGLNAMAGAGAEDGDSLWSTFDLDGDQRPDLVVTAIQINNVMKAPGHPTSAHWEVYPNTGTGFGPIQTWALPRRGTGHGGVFTTHLVSANVAGDDAWSVQDVDGDRRPDLLITGEFVSGIEPGTYGLGRLANDPHWLVYPNTGTAFGAEPKRWDLPVGGLGELGFQSTWGVGAKEGDESWGLVDLTGDRQPELVIFGTSIERPDSPGFGFTFPVALGLGSNPHWAAHRNVP